MFNWHTEENWEEIAPPPPAGRPGRWRLWVAGFIAILLLAWGLSRFFYQQAQQKVSEQEVALQTEVQSSYTLVQLANEEQDVELLRQVLDRTDYEWARNQERLVNRHLLLDRSAYGLTPAGDPTVLDITLNPTYQTALLATEVPYLTAAGEPTSLILWHEYEKKEQDSRWHYYPIPAEVWGTQQMTTTTHFVVYYPSRDTEVIQQLLPLLESYFLEACQKLTSSLMGQCQFNGRLELLFDTDLATFVNGTGQEVTFYTVFGQRENPDQIALPAPTLIGWPTTPPAVQALAKGYATQLVAAHLVQQRVFGCCSAFNQGLLDRLLADLELRPWSLQPADYAHYFRAPFFVGEWLLQSSIYTQNDQTNHKRNYLMADYVYHLLHNGYPDLLHTIKRHPNTWLSQNETLAPQTPAGVKQLTQFLYQQAQLTPPNLPDLPQTISALCYDQAYYWMSNKPAYWQQYDESTGGWYTQTTLPSDGLINLLPLADGSTAELRVHTAKGTFLTWQDQSYQLSYQSQPLTTFLIPNPSVPANQFLLGEASSSPNRLTSYLLDLQNCQGENCELTPLVGTPLWNEAHSHTLLKDEAQKEEFFTSLLQEQQPLSVGDAAGQPLQQVGVGAFPFWVDNGRYGFARPAGDNGFEIVQQTIGSADINVWLTWPEIQAQLPDQVNGHQPSLNQVAVVPQRPELLLIAINLARGNQSPLISQVDLTQILLYNWQTQTWLGEALLPGDLHQFNWSSTGQWVLASSSYGLLYLLELPHLTPLFSSDVSLPQDYLWSADGQWLLNINNGFFTLYQPAQKQLYVQLYNHNLPFCTSGRWLTPSP